MDTLATVTAETFMPHIQDVFELRAQEAVIELRLMDVQIFDKGPLRDRPVIIDGEEIPPRQQFTLLFDGPTDKGFQQGSFPLSHPELGEMTLLLSCIDASETERRYQAVFG